MTNRWIVIIMAMSTLGVACAGQEELDLATGELIEPAEAQSDLHFRRRLPPIEVAIEKALAASRKYIDRPDVAEADGYVVGSPCEHSEEGTMGIHYVHPAKTAGRPKLSDPPILVYLPTDEGLRLVAVEYFQAVIQDGEPYMGSASEPPRSDSLPRRPPELFDGYPFDGPMAGHNPQMPWHYDQHVWLYEHNPEGLFAMWNTAIACPGETPVETP